MNLNLQAIGHEAHDAGGFDPGNLFQRSLALTEWNEEDVAANVSAHSLDYLGTGYVFEAADFDVVTRLHPKTPGVLAIVIESGDR